MSADGKVNDKVGTYVYLPPFLCTAPTTYRLCTWYLVQIRVQNQLQVKRALSLINREYITNIVGMVASPTYTLSEERHVLCKLDTL